MYKITESNGNVSTYAHFETVFYKVLAITGCKKEAMKASDSCQFLKSGEKYIENNFKIEII